jgi:hypothetical protein
VKEQSASFNIIDSSGQPGVYVVPMVDLLSTDKMSKTPIDLRMIHKFEENAPVSVLFESDAVVGKTTFYSQLWRYVTDFLIRKLPAQASTSRTTSSSKSCCIPTLHGVPGAGR